MDWKSTWKLEFPSNVYDDVRNKYFLFCSSDLIYLNKHRFQYLLQQLQTVHFASNIRAKT